jgi:hypothetical protein
MFIEVDGYVLSYDKYRNKIVISLPQTAETQTNTFEPIRERRTDLSMKEQLALLSAVFYMFERRDNAVS